ncbi:hypothetical protein ZWY2020_032535 [Hordeum vulgare]|nr:hypothetical protein ZWY2020_032535 [Hordeum vulgare]
MVRSALYCSLSTPTPLSSGVVSPFHPPRGLPRRRRRGPAGAGAGAGSVSSLAGFMCQAGYCSVLFLGSDLLN